MPSRNFILNRLCYCSVAIVSQEMRNSLRKRESIILDPPNFMPKSPVPQKTHNVCTSMASDRGPMGRWLATYGETSWLESQ